MRPPLSSSRSQMVAAIGWASIFWLTPAIALLDTYFYQFDLGWRLVLPVLPVVAFALALTLIRRTGLQTMAAWFRLSFALAAIGNLALMTYAWTAPDVRPAPLWWAWLLVDCIVLRVAWRTETPSTAAQILTGVAGLVGCSQLLAAGLCGYAPACARSSIIVRPAAVQLVIEGYHGFNIVRQFGDYFAIRQADGPFYYERFVTKGYKPSFAATSVVGAQLQVNRYLGLPATIPEDNDPRVLLTSPDGVAYVEYAGRFFGLPPDGAPFDPERFKSGGYSLKITGDSLEDVELGVAKLQANYLSPGEFEMRTGFYPSEGINGKAFPRWAGGQAALNFFPERPGPVVFSAKIVQPQTATMGGPDLTLTLDGTPLPDSQLQLVRTEPGHFQLTATLSDEQSRLGPRQLLLLSPVFVPAQQLSSMADSRELADFRELGTYFEAVSLVSGVDELLLKDNPVETPITGGPTQIIPAIYTWRRGTPEGNGGGQ